MTDDYKQSKRSTRLCHLAGLIANLTKPVARSQGFSHHRVLFDWENIVGIQFAAICQPEKVVFSPKMDGGYAQGRLIVRTPSAMAPELSFLEPKILEKINRYYGYPAVHRLIIRHGTISRPTVSAPKPDPVLAPQDRLLIENETRNLGQCELEKALFDWGCKIFTYDTQKN